MEKCYPTLTSLFIPSSFLESYQVYRHKHFEHTNSYYVYTLSIETRRIKISFNSKYINTDRLSYEILRSNTLYFFLLEKNTMSPHLLELYMDNTRRYRKSVLERQEILLMRRKVDDKNSPLSLW